MARYIAGIVRWFGGVEIVVAEVNGEPGVFGRRGDTVIGVLALEIRDGRIAALRAIANPAKLGYVNRQAAALSQSARHPVLKG